MCGILFQDILKLHMIELGIAPVFCQKLLMASGFYNSSPVHDDNSVYIYNGRQAVCNDDGGTVLHQIVKCVLYQLLRFGI